MACEVHKRYKAKRKPQCSCLACWEMYLRTCVTEEFSADEMLGVVEAGIDYEDELFDTLMKLGEIVTGVKRRNA